MTVVDVSVAGEVRREQVEDARRAILELTRYAHADRIQSARLTVRRSHSRHFLHRPYVADASVLVDGRVLAAHVAAAYTRGAARAAAERLRRQVRRVIDADVALRNEPRVIKRALEALGVEPEREPDWEPVPPDEPLPITPVATPADIPVGTLSAVADLIDLDVLFYLFVHVRTDEAVVVHRRDDGRIGLLFPRAASSPTRTTSSCRRRAGTRRRSPSRRSAIRWISPTTVSSTSRMRQTAWEGPVPPSRG